MKKLRDLGLISTRPGTSGEFHYVIMINPLHMIKKPMNQEGWVKDERYNALFSGCKKWGLIGNERHETAVRRRYKQRYEAAAVEVVERI
ncbi:hypothetical protein AB2F75_24225 (plasmid) [Escherichia coli]